MAHVERRGADRWRARYRTPDGRERSRTFRRKVDADRFLTSVEHEKLSGSYVDPAAGRLTFRDYAEQWRRVQIHRAATATSVEQHLRLHVYPRIGDRPIGSIRPSEIQALVRSLDEDLAASTIGVVHGRVAAVFHAAVRDRVIATSPCVGIKLPRARAAAALEVLTTDQIHGLSAAVPDRYAALVLTGAGTGLRPGELFGLSINQVDFLRRTVRVSQQLIRVRGVGVRVGPLKTQASYRDIPLPTVIADALAAHLQAWPPHDELGLVFTNRDDEPIQQHPFAVVWATARRNAGCPSWATPHDLRHYYASLLIQSGASIKVLQTRLGHASAKTTLDTYGHLFPDEADRTRSAIDAELATSAPTRRDLRSPQP
jgi:integrase